MKHLGRQLERRWSKSKSKEDRTLARAHDRSDAVVVMAAPLCQGDHSRLNFFRVIKSLIHVSDPEDVESSVERCEQLVRCFADKHQSDLA